MQLRKGKSGVLLYGIYQYYRNQCEFKGADKKNEFNVSYKQFSDVVNRFNNKLKNELIYNSCKFVLPYRIGSMYIKRKKVILRLDEEGNVIKKGLIPDWKKTLELWKKVYPGQSKEELKLIKNKQVVYNLNEHTYGYRFFLFWSKKTSNIKNHGPYEFVFAKSNRRELARALRSNPNITYYE